MADAKDIVPREPLRLDISEKNVIKLLAEGDGTGRAVLGAMQQENGGHIPVTAFMALDDMNIRGPQLYLAYQVVNGDLKVLRKLVVDRDDDLKEGVNKLAQMAGIVWKAMQAGGHISIARERFDK